MKYNMLSQYQKLPDYMSVEEIEKYYIELMEYVESADNFDSLRILEALLQLADRQWHTYHKLNNEVAERIEKLLCKVWNSQSSEIIKYISYHCCPIEL